MQNAECKMTNDRIPHFTFSIPAADLILRGQRLRLRIAFGQLQQFAREPLQLRLELFDLTPLNAALVAQGKELRFLRPNVRELGDEKHEQTHLRDGEQPEEIDRFQ